jgi:hypothetical protein
VEWKRHEDRVDGGLARHTENVEVKLVRAGPATQRYKVVKTAGPNDLGPLGGKKVHEVVKLSRDQLPLNERIENSIEAAPSST